MKTRYPLLLVLDREPVMRQYIISCVLQCGDYEFIELQDFAQLLNLIREKQPLVVIFDPMQAHGHDIIQLIETAKNISVDYLPIFIAVSSVDYNEKTAVAFESGADFYLPKNFSHCHIRGILNSILHLDNLRARIRENECYYRTMFEKAGDAVFIVSLQEMNIYDANPQACLVYGYHKRELLSLNFVQLTENISALKEKLLNKVSLLMHVRQKRKDGDLFPASLAFAYFDRNNKPSVIITVKDLSEIERQQEEKEALLDFRTVSTEKASSEMLAVLRGEQNERRRISRGIHDHIGQQLVSIKLELESQTLNTEYKTSRADIMSLRDQMVSAISSLRRLSSRITGDYLPHADWVESLRALIEHMRRRNKMKITLQSPKNTPEMSAFVQGHIYRIIEESLTNAIKHSAEKMVLISIDLQHTRHLLVQITSRGLSGHNEFNPTPGIGMRIMRERARLIQSELLFEVTAQDEFVVQLKVPL